MATNLGVRNGAPFYDDESPLDTHTVVLRDGYPVLLSNTDALVEVESFTVERSVDDGDTWELVVQSPGSHFQFSDFESLSNGVTIYRVTTYAATGAATVREYPMAGDSIAFWFGGGEGYADIARLPFNPEYENAPDRLRGTFEVSGGETIAWSDARVSREVLLKGTLNERYPEQTALMDDVERVSLAPEPVHCLRTPDGRRFYVVLQPGTRFTRSRYLPWEYALAMFEVSRR